MIQQIISQLSTELKRLNKMPEWINKHGELGSDKDAHDSPITMEEHDEIVLAALSGVAAEVAAEKQITIFYYKIYGINGKADTAFDGWQINDWRIENYMVDDKIPTYHEALVSALKQIETENKP